MNFSFEFHKYRSIFRAWNSFLRVSVIETASHLVDFARAGRIRPILRMAHFGFTDICIAQFRPCRAKLEVQLSWTFSAACFV